MLVTLSGIRLFLIYLLLVVSWLAVTGCSEPKTSYDYLTQARQEYDNGKSNAALINLKNALKKDPKNGEARLLLAQIYNEKDEGSSAEIEVRKAIEFGVAKSYAAATLGEALFLQKQYKKVLDEVKVAEGDKGKAAADIYNVRGNAYLALRKVDDAQSTFEKALKVFPDSVDAYLGMSRLALLDNDINEALRQTETALSMAPQNLKAWLFKAVLLMDQKKDDEARSAFNHVLQVDKSNVPAHLGLASLDMSQKKLEVAKSEIDTALKIAPKSLSALYALGLVEFERRNLKDALDAVQKVLKVAPDHMPSVLLHGVINYSQRSYDIALSDVRRVVTRFPEDAYARRLLAAIQLKLGDTNHALETLQPLLKPGLEDSKALALAGEAQLLAKNYNQATEYFQKAIDIDPSANQLQTQLAISRLGLGKTEQALNELEDAVKGNPGQSPADILLIVIRLQYKQFDQALAAITKLENKMPPNPITYYLTGIAMLGEGKNFEARKAFEKALAVQPGYDAAIIKLAQLDMSENKPGEAQKRLEKVFEKDRKDLRVILALADIAHEQKHDEEYIDWLKKAREARPTAIIPVVKMADYYLAKNDKAKALNVAKEAVNTFPGNPKALDLLGATQLAAGNIEEALKTFTILVEESPNTPTSYLRLALAQAGTKRLKEARVSLLKALKLEPDFQQAQELLIRVEIAENKQNEALNIARKMQARQPESPVGYDREADILMSQKHYPQAIKAYEQALMKKSSTVSLLKLVQAQVRARDMKSAEQQLNAWIKNHPKDLAVREYAAEMYTQNDHNAEAIKQYEEILRLAPQNVLALNNLAALYQLVQDSRALVTAERAEKLAPENPGVLDTLGWILVKQGQLPKGLKFLSKAAEKAPDAGSVRYHYGAALARSGRISDAKKELEAAIATGHKFPELVDAKAMLKNL